VAAQSSCRCRDVTDGEAYGYDHISKSWASHVQFDPRGRFLRLGDGETIGDYIIRHINEGRIFIGIEGNELTLGDAIRLVGNKPFIFSSDYPHEVDANTCRAELEELREHPGLTSEDKDAILFFNSARFYRISVD